MNKQNYLKIGYLLFFLSITKYLNAQFLSGKTFEPNIHYGKIFKHSPNFRPDIHSPTVGAELQFSSQTTGKKSWHELHRYPIFGWALGYMNFGDRTIFGSALYVAPNIVIDIIRRPKWQLNFRMGAGVAYINRPYNILTNPTNNVIGSKINNITAFRLGLAYHLNPNWGLQLSGSFTHFSNGASQYPNLGINVPALNMGVKYTPYPVLKENYTHHDTLPSHRKKWHIGTSAAIGLRELGTTGGPKYPIYIGSIYSLYALNPIHRLILGYEFELTQGFYEFNVHTYQFDTEAENRWQATRHAVTIADEVLFGRLALYGQVGIYVTKKHLQPFPVYTKIAVRYYFTNPRHNKVQPFIGVYLKAHKIVADYFSVGGGISF